MVRFGRALGFGARQAVKTVTAAVDAATAENPSRNSAETRAPARPASVSPASARPPDSGPTTPVRGAANPSPAAPPTATGKAAHAAAQSVVRARGARQRLRRGGRGLRETTWRTFTRLGGVLWLEVSGVFFGIFALFALGGVWRLRAAWHPTPTNMPEHRQLLGALAMLALFGYFTVSNFVRARRRERRR